MSRDTSLATPSLESTPFAFQQSSPLSLRQQPFSSPPAPPFGGEGHDYNFSPSAETETETDDHLAIEDTQDVDLSDVDRRISGCSSISSFPASSIAPHQPSSRHIYHEEQPRTPTRHESFSVSHSFEGPEGLDHKLSSPRSAREYHSAFRHPSSVRALQMRDEAMSETRSVLRHHRRSGSQMSAYSQRSSYSTSTSPTKRSSRSHRTSPQKPSSSLRKEFPLVLLHCTLLPPTLLPHITAEEDPFLVDLLPAEYRKRWDALKQRLVDDLEVKSRGILIPHPREDYELLEERLMDTLDLENPRIRHNHFLHQESSNADSGFESGSVTDEDDDARCNIMKEAKCIDCGSDLHSNARDRKWDIKVYAANGLMRAGAWAAAWQEMEKVDVEIRVRLPEAIRKDLETRMNELEASRLASSDDHFDLGHVNLHEESIIQTREQEVYGISGRSRNQAEIDGFYDEIHHEHVLPQEIPFPPREEPDLQKLLFESAQKFSQDRKNVLVVFLSLLVLFFAMAGKQQLEPANGNGIVPAKLTEVLTTTITATAVSFSTETITSSISLETISTEAIEEVASRIEAETEVELVSADTYSSVPILDTSTTTNEPVHETTTASLVPVHDKPPPVLMQ
ncbi:hypothetical protein LTR84_013112 [Exophiala bonariae]|uniref:Pathway-specific nitrogen regulator n=1 Tax=Exophiala bonariae TaxID=1690606 RepID=A0AAV9NF32_9EURO|nr:hypothetical protein LTR84_013112 [Exophiala bonariae]